MLFVLGKVKKNNSIVGYRVLDIALRPTLPKLENAIVNSTIKTLDTYNILKILHSRDGNRYFQFVNARLGYSISADRMYYLHIKNDQPVWAYAKPGGGYDCKVIPDYTSLSLDRLSLEGLDGSLSAYGTYGDRYPIYVIIAEYKDDKGRNLGYIVADSNSESNQIEFLPTPKLIEKVILRETKAGVKCIANAYLREGQIVAKSKFNANDSFVTIRVRTETAQQKPTQEAETRPLQRPGMLARNRVVQPSSPTSSTAPQVNSVSPGEQRVPNELTVLKAGQLFEKPLTKLVVHERVTEISPDALLMCPNFAKFEVSKSNLHICSPGGLLMSKDGHTLIRCPSNSDLTITTLPDYIQVIAKGAFRGCKNIRTLTIPATVRLIEAGAFCAMPNLTRVICYAKKISGDAFVDCPNLEKLILGFGVETIVGTLVRNTGKLQYLVLPDSVREVIPSKYPAMTERGYASQSAEHKLIEENKIRYVFAPNISEAKSWVVNLYSDPRMYSLDVKRFKYTTNSLHNLRQYNLEEYDGYIR